MDYSFCQSVSEARTNPEELTVLATSAYPGLSPGGQEVVVLHIKVLHLGKHLNTHTHTHTHTQATVTCVYFL